MARDLIKLIKAGGVYAGTSGQTFRSHVPGAVSTAFMHEFDLWAWEFSDQVPAPELIYTGIRDFHMNLAFSQGARASNIKRIGAVATILPVNVPPGSSVGFTQNSIVGAATGSEVTVQVAPGYNPSATPYQNSGWFDGYTAPTSPPGQAAEPVLMYHALSGAGGSGSQHIQWYIQYVPGKDNDAAGYNPILSQFFDAHLYNRAEDIGDWEFQWFSDSGYSTLVFDGPAGVTIYSNPGQTTTFWTRARRVVSGGSWSPLGAVSFTDPRVPA